MHNPRNIEYYLPGDTAKLLTQGQLKKCKNLGLILDKYPPETAVQKSEDKSNWLREITSGNYIDAELTESAYRRWLNMTTAVGALHFSAVTDWRMVVGLGGETVLETDLTLHHLYGIPYIPGSALKGLTRAYVSGEVFPSKDIEHDNETVKQIFGSQDRAGTVIFFDAMPVDGKATFALDIMNSHYPNYYGEKKPPTNDQNPNPVTFLTVTSTTFMFALAARDPRYTDDVNKAKDWLQKALEKYGVGGKTNAGYGYFKIQPPYVRPNIPNFSVGAEIRGVVIDERNEPFVAQFIQAGKASKGLRFQPFPPKGVLILIEATYEEAKNWKANNTSICQFIEEREEDGCTLLICKPRKR
jgi:CRISPR type III-B/RAMP module RAMP protein Cmr6